MLIMQAIMQRFLKQFLASLPTPFKAPFSPLVSALLATLFASCAVLQPAAPRYVQPTTPEPARPHDARVFTTTSASTFAAMAAAPTDTVAMDTTSRWAGVLGKDGNGAAYQIEVPANWNGMLMMYAHGYRGTGAALTVNPPQIRRHLIQQGYAWAASSYSKNYYDVRAGIEDTNALALAFNSIAASNGRALSVPKRLYISGHSMGGHIAAAAVEAETAATARNKVAYQGAVPMCGVTADTELFQILSKQQVAAQAAADLASHPTEKWSEISSKVTSTLFATFPTASSANFDIIPTTKGEGYVNAVKQLTGGERPLFAQGMAYGGSFRFAYGGFGSDGTVNGILTSNLLTDPQANRLRSDGMRWITAINGEFNVPVVSIHTLGDLYVPFAMMQHYEQRAIAKGSAKHLVQRAIRGAAHCDFTVKEQVQAFDDMVTWEQTGKKPAGDEVLHAATVAASNYGCAFTNNALTQDDTPNVRQLRGKIAQTTPACR
jgi:pimeloyl-ACP methyl ester carboxylesterase